MKNKKNILYPAIIAVLLGLLLLSHLSIPAFAQPGTASDPLVTQHYVDELVAGLQAQITALQNQINTGVPSGGGGTGEGQVVPFTPLFVPAGSTLMANAGVEFILRSGNATVIAGPNGLVDVTAGIDVGNGQAVSRNHLMLVPATDGRGLYFSTDAWLMIKGGFIVAN
ncbi:MAG: hypothetical protein FWE11_03135 [Defluviitaleaceae bacterium]|nr:hypothetical protein [Defluviitaleaceae bacterium]